MIIHLEGELGSGKTFFANQLLAFLHCLEIVKSPTYSIIEWYSLERATVAHIDLYRISSELELHPLGLDQVYQQCDLILIEWASLWESYLPKPNHTLTFLFQNQIRQIALMSW